MPTGSTLHVRREDEPSRHEVWRMFDHIAPRYDFLNRFLSAGRDVAWRRRMARYVPEGDGLGLLDLATGTGDQILSLLRYCPRIARATGIDMAERMLAIGRAKVERRGLADRVQLRRGDATEIPVTDGAFDVLSISFGIRNVTDVGIAMAEMHRVLRPGGRALILEFSLPASKPLRAAHLFYLRRILPVLGGLISGDWKAYRYLNQTIESFPYGAAFCGLMRTAGFVNVRAHPLTFGIATIYQGDRAEG